jgi:MoxR-like ATPase
MATRRHGDVSTGASSRASIALVRGSRACAALRERTYVIPDDIKWLAPRVLRHRLVLTREAEISDITPAAVIEEILETVEVP